MKNLLTILLLLFTVSLSAQIDKIVNGTFNLTTTSTAGGTGDYVVQGTFTDLNDTYSVTDVQVGDFYLDGSGDLFEILVINTQIGSILNLDVQDVDNQGTLPSGNGAIFRMTKDGYVPIVNGVSATLQSKINNFAIYSIREEVDLAGCTDTITEVGHGLAISNPVSLAGASDYNAIADQTTVPVAFVLDVIDANTYVLQRCGLVRISDLPTATQATWNGIADGLYYVDELGGITSTTPVTGLIRPTIYKGDGRIQVVQFYGFGQSSGGSLSDGTYGDVTVSGSGATWTVVSATTATAGKVQLVDEDNMASDSDVLVPTQQSVKAYVDNNDTQTLTAAPVDGTTIAFRQGQLFWDRVNKKLYEALTASTNPLVAGTGSTFKNILADTTTIRPETFGAVADFSRNSATFTAGDNTVTCATCNFTSDDVGDYIAIKFATTNTSYSNRKIALNTTIASVTNSTTIELTDAPTESGTHTMNWGKNNFQAFLDMFEYCADNNIRSVSFSGGNYGVSAKDITFSLANKNQVGSLKGIVQRGSLTILGNGSTIKDMWEDQQLVDELNEVSYSVLLLAEDGERRFFNFSIESPDRTHTKDYDTDATGLRTAEDSPLIKLYGDGFNITSGAGGHRDGFANAVYSSTGGNYNTTTKEIEDYFIIDLQNCKLEADNTVVTRYSDNPANIVKLHNVEQKGGIAIAGQTIASGFNISSGSSTLTIDAAADTLSFYDFKGLVGTSVTIGGSFTATVSSITDGQTLELSSNAGSTFSNASFDYATGTGSTVKFGHGNYIHPNISIDFKNVRNNFLGSSQGFMLHYFSSTGVAGSTRFFRFENVKGIHDDGNEMILDLNSPNLNLSSLDSLDFTLKNCAFRLNAGFTPKMKIENCNLQGEMAFYNDVIISNSKGNVRTLGTGSTYTLLNHDGNIDFEDGTGSLFATNCEGELTLENGVDILRWVGGNLQSIRFPNTASNITDGLVLNTYANPNDLGVNVFLQTNNIDDITELKKRFKFRNLEIPSKDIRNWNSQFITGMLPLLNAEDTEEITALKSVVETAAFQIQTDYSIDYNHVVFPYNANSFRVNLSGYADVLWINEQGNTNLFREFAVSTSAFSGIVDINPTGTAFELRTGGNIRLKNTGVRTQTSRFRLIPESLIFEELDNNRYTASSIPTRTDAVNNEIVYNADQSSSDKSWTYVIETTSVTGEAFTPPSTTLPYVFTLANIPYRKEREQSFIDPDFEITVPRTGGNDVLTLGVWGELYNQNGTNVGSLNINTGEVTIRTLSTGVLTLADVTVDYEYISSQNWVVDKSASTSTFTTVQTANFTITVGEYNLFDTTLSGGNITATVPAGITAGQSFEVHDNVFSAGTNACVVDFGANGYTVHGQTTSTINGDGTGYRYICVDGTNFISEEL